MIKISKQNPIFYMIIKKILIKNIRGTIIIFCGSISYHNLREKSIATKKQLLVSVWGMSVKDKHITTKN